MLALALVFSVLFVIFALILGGLVGWTVKQHLEQREPYTYHPEMFDENGQVLPDEIIAFRFENTDSIEEEEETED
jgi:hypothetical protein